MNIAEQNHINCTDSNIFLPIIKLFFVSTNKFKYLQMKHLLNTELELIDANIQEIQGTSDEIIRDKLEKACQRFPDKYIIVDDSSICIKSLNGFPGPYGKYFLDMGIDVVEDLILKMGGNTILECKLGFGILRNGKMEVNIFTGCIEGEIMKRLNGLKEKLKLKEKIEKLLYISEPFDDFKNSDDIEEACGSFLENKKFTAKQNNFNDCINSSEKNKIKTSNKNIASFDAQTKSSPKISDEEFDKMFFNIHLNKFMCDLSPEEKKEFSHRGIAVGKLKAYLKENKFIM